MSDDLRPLPGSVIFDAVHDKETIIMAANIRMFPGVGKGIFRAARDTDSAILIEIARSESDLSGGYTGMTPQLYGEKAIRDATEVGHDVWALHADHITVKKGDEEDIAGTKALIDGQIEAGFTSFAIDASHLYNFQGGDLKEEMMPNITTTITLAKHIQERMGDRPFGLEVEVGEIGRKGDEGRVVTTPDEARVFITALNEAGIQPHVLAIANGTAHGNTYDEHGNLIEQVSIDIDQTKAVAQALRDMGSRVRIAQHGITGTPRELIATRFPRGSIIKGNVATFYQNLFWDTLQVYNPEFYKRIWDWVQETKGPGMPGKSLNEIFGKQSKFAIKQFYDELHALDKEFTDAVEALSYAETMVFLKAFNSGGTASMVRAML